MTTPQLFFQRLLDDFKTAQEKTSNVFIKHFDLNGEALRLLIVGSSCLQNLTLALEHIALPASSDPAVTICCFDSVTTDSPIPPPPWTADDYRKRGEIRGFENEQLKATYNIEAGLLSMADLEKKIGIFWIQDPADLPYYEIAAPFRRIIHWWMNNRNKEVIHCAAVGMDNKGVLIAGKSGSGKSTASLACLLSDMFFAGDDYVLLNDGPEPHVFSLYNSAKLDWKQIQIFPALKPLIWNFERRDEEKALLFLHDKHPEKISRDFPAKAILVPRITGQSRTIITRTLPADGLKALAPSTIFQQPWAGRFTFKIIANLVKRIPSYQMNLGTDIMALSGTIKDFIQTEVR